MLRTSPCKRTGSSGWSSRGRGRGSLIRTSRTTTLQHQQHCRVVLFSQIFNAWVIITFLEFPVVVKMIIMTCKKTIPRAHDDILTMSSCALDRSTILIWKVGCELNQKDVHTYTLHLVKEYGGHVYHECMPNGCDVIH